MALKLPNLERMEVKPIKVNLFGKSFRETGHDFELRVRKELIKKGYKISKAKSRHYDWLAQKQGKTWFVECKMTTARLSSDEEKFFANALKKGQNYIIARRTKTGRIDFDFY